MSRYRPSWERQEPQSFPFEFSCSKRENKLIEEKGYPFKIGDLVRSKYKQSGLKGTAIVVRYRWRKSYDARGTFADSVVVSFPDKTTTLMKDALTLVEQ
tara:strand:+ start:184 stop:480 length:297 start_codon:yes stop_codon:yes gene_type:complete